MTDSGVVVPVGDSFRRGSPVMRGGSCVRKPGFSASAKTHCTTFGLRSAGFGSSSRPRLVEVGRARREGLASMVAAADGRARAKRISHDAERGTCDVADVRCRIPQTNQYWNTVDTKPATREPMRLSKLL